MVSFENVAGPVAVRLLAKLATFDAVSFPYTRVSFENVAGPVAVRLLAKLTALDAVSFP